MTEGENVDRALSFGLPATGNVGAAGKWMPEMNQYLRGKKVYIVRNNNDAWARHAYKTLKFLTEDPIYAHIITSHAKDVPEKGDFSVWMDANNNDINLFIKLSEQDRKN